MKTISCKTDSLPYQLFLTGLMTLFLIVTSQGFAVAKTLRVISGFPQTNLYTEGCLGIFGKNLVEISGGQLTLQISGPDVVPTNEQFQPLQAGVFDMLFTHPAYHLGTTAVGASLEAIHYDPKKRRTSGIIKNINNHYKQHGVTLTAVFPMAKYNIVLKNAVGKQSPSLQGLKIRTNPLAAPMIKSLGGAPVNLPPGEIYTAMQKGVIDGFTIVSVGLEDYKFYEVAGYLARPTFGFISASLFMNLNKFQQLSAQEKQWVQQAAVKSETEVMEFFGKKHLDEVKRLKSLGMAETQLNSEDVPKLNQVFNATVWAVAEKYSGKAAKDLHQLAIKKGMTK